MPISASDSAQPPKSIKTAVRFSVLVLIVILLGLTVKLMINVTQRTFDGRHRFTIAITRKDPTSDILSFAPENQTISLLHVKGKSSSIGQDLSTPIDATVFLPRNVPVDDPHAFMAYLAAHIGETRTVGMNAIDATTLEWFSQKVKSDNISVQTVSLPLDPNINLASLFSDRTIYGEGKSISVINATNESGFGSRMTRLITTMGGNVISVTSASENQNGSTIQYYGEKSYTVERLAKTLKYKLVPMAKQTFSDIIITIGTDNTDVEAF